MIRVREAVPDDAAMLLPFLRAPDRLEVERADGDVAIALRSSIERSRLRVLFLNDDVPLCLMGIVEFNLLDPSMASPWLIGTEALDQNPKAFLRETRRWLTEIRHSYSLLVNWVDADYAKAIRWLEWLGFEVYPSEPFGPHRAPFRRFEMRS
jgi:hypothetical protein